MENRNIKNSKVLFIIPPMSAYQRYGRFSSIGGVQPSLGVGYLAAHTRTANYNTEIIDAEVAGYSIEETVKKVIDGNYRYICITSTTPSIYSVSQIAKMIKERDNHSLIILGGNHISSIPEQTMNECSHIDIGVIGEGEETLVELLNILEQNGDLNSIHGLIYRRGSTTIKTTRRGYIRDLDSLPPPAWDLFPSLSKCYRQSKQNTYRLPSTNLITSRGCPEKCTFCDRSVFENRVRQHSADYIMDMVRYLSSNHEIRDIHFVDDNFLLFKKRLSSICEQLLNEKLDVSWSCFARGDRIDMKQLKMIKKAGCWQISYGIESGDEKILGLCKKRISLPELKNTLRLTKSVGIRTKGFFMIGHPAETLESLQNTANFIEESLLDDISITFYTPMPGAEIYEKIEKYGSVVKNWEKYSHFEPVFIPKNLTKDDLLKFHKEVYRRFYTKPATLLNYMKRISRPKVMWDFLKAGFPFVKSILRSEERDAKDSYPNL